MNDRTGSIVVRRFEPSDATPVADMLSELAAFHHEKASATSSDFIRYASGPGRLSTVWVALLDEATCGFSSTFDWMNYVHGFPVRNIDLLYVRQAERRRGVGRALIAAIASDAKMSSCRRITVGAERDNMDANGFYMRMGFELRSPGSNRYAISGQAFEDLIVPST